MREDYRLVRRSHSINDQAVNATLPPPTVSNGKEISRGGVPFQSPVKRTPLALVDFGLMMQLRQGSLKIITQRPPIVREPRGISRMVKRQDLSF